MNSNTVKMFLVWPTSLLLSVYLNLKSAAHVDKSIRMLPHQPPNNKDKDKKKEAMAKVNEVMKVLGQRYKSSHPLPKKKDFLDTKPIVIDRRLHSIREVDET